MNDDILNDLFGDEINEGLIRTVDPEKVVERIQFGQLNIKGVPILYKNRMIGIQFSHLKGTPSIEITEQEYNRMNQIMNNFGYIPAYYSAAHTFLKTENFNEKKVLEAIRKKYDLISIVYSPKFSSPIEKYSIPVFIYHICDGSVLEKIKKIGLSPKTNNKIENHPDRVYFCTSTECMKKLLKHSQFIKNTTSDKIYLLKIDTRKIDVDFYTDPSLDDAIYTHENISPSYIEVSQELDKPKKR